MNDHVRPCNLKPQQRDLTPVLRRPVEPAELKRTSRLGAQVVTINAELLHFHSTPPASESSIGGIDLIGAKSAAQASVRNTTISKGRFIAVLPSSGVCRLAAFCTPRLIERHCYQASVSASLRGQGKWFRSVDELFRGRMADEVSSRDRDRCRLLARAGPIGSGR